jgi:hypothetical protein
MTTFVILSEAKNLKKMFIPNEVGGHWEGLGN